MQGWKCFSPSFDGVSFVSFYIELPVMLVMFVGWKLIKRTKFVRLDEMDLETDVHTADEAEEEKIGWQTKAKKAISWVF